MSIQVTDNRTKSRSAGQSTESSRAALVSPEQMEKCLIRACEMLVDGSKPKIEAAFPDKKVPASHLRRVVSPNPIGQIVSQLVNKGQTEGGYVRSVIDSVSELHRNLTHNEVKYTWVVEDIEIRKQTHRSGYQPHDTPRPLDSALAVISPAGATDPRVQMGDTSFGAGALGRIAHEEQDTISIFVTFAAMEPGVAVLRVAGEPKHADQHAAEAASGNAEGRLAAALERLIPSAPMPEPEGEKLHHKTREAFERQIAELKAQLAAKS